jgi:WD40 repeat protein
VPVASSTHTVAVLPVKARPEPEPVAPNLITSLVHPQRKAAVSTVQFSLDGTRLLVAGYPSGVVQIWAWAAKKEVRRIETPPGSRGSSRYALVTPDWQKLYVPVDKRVVKRIERDGKRFQRIEYSGAIRIWDLATGKELRPLQTTLGSGPAYAQIAPDGRFLLCSVRASYDTSTNQADDAIIAFDLTTGEKWRLRDGFTYPCFAPDGKTVALNTSDKSKHISAVSLIDVATRRETAHFQFPDADRSLAIGPFTPDGDVLAVRLGGTKGAPLEVWFLDGRTLVGRGKLMGRGDPERFGWGHGDLTPDGKHYIAVDSAGEALVWNIAERKIGRTLATGAHGNISTLQISPDGMTLAIAWWPKFSLDSDDDDIDPQDLPQPRVSLLDLGGARPPRILITPHGYIGGLAFSPDGRTLALGGAGAVHLFDLTKTE